MFAKPPIGVWTGEGNGGKAACEEKVGVLKPVAAFGKVWDPKAPAEPVNGWNWPGAEKPACPGKPGCIGFESTFDLLKPILNRFVWDLK